MRPDRASRTRVSDGERVHGARGTARRREVAEEICVLYHEAVRAEIAALTKGGRRHSPSAGLDDCDPSDRRWFVRAAQICIDEGADAREFLVAQFSRWREASAYHRKLLLPMPHHLGKLGARVRLLQHKANVETRRARAVVVDEPDGRKRFYVEERQLRGMARVGRTDPADVLAEQPERFSREFLKHKGVWEAVRDVWEERAR